MLPSRCKLLVAFSLALIVGRAELFAIGCESDKARKIIAAGIEAAGGADNLSKFNVSTWNEVGVFYGMGDGLPYRGKMAVQWPHQFRMEVAGVFTLVLNGEKGWIIMGDRSRPMTANELAEQKEQHFSAWLPLRDAGFELTALDEGDVDGRAATVVKVSRDGHRDVTLYFDKETSLLVKSVQMVKPMGQGKEVRQEVYYRDYSDMDGARIPVTIDMRRDGKRFVEARIKDLRAVDRLDDKVFSDQKPGDPKPCDRKSCGQRPGGGRP
jgi:hypothetical protein